MVKRTTYKFYSLGFELNALKLLLDAEEMYEVSVLKYTHDSIIITVSYIDAEGHKINVQQDSHLYIQLQHRLQTFGRYRLLEYLRSEDDENIVGISKRAREHLNLFLDGENDTSTVESLMQSLDVMKEAEKLLALNAVDAAVNVALDTRDKALFIVALGGDSNA